MKLRQIPYLDDLRAFEATARLGSVRAAGDDLAITHAAVSRRIKRLGERMNAPLFEKEGRGLRLSVAGQQMFDCCTRIFEDLEQTSVAIRDLQADDNPPVLLSCERSVAMRWLIPRLNAFEALHPEVKVHLSVGGGDVLMDANRPTLALRRLDFAIPVGWQVVKLFEETVGPVMAPELLSSFQAGHYTALCAKTRPEAWDAWLRLHPHVRTPAEKRMFDHHFLMVEAACSGLGVAMCPRVIALDDVKRGRLVASDGFKPDGSHYGVLHPAGEQLSAAAQVLIEWLADTMRGLSQEPTITS